MRKLSRAVVKQRKKLQPKHRKKPISGATRLKIRKGIAKSKARGRH